MSSASSHNRKEIAQAVRRIQAYAKQMEKGAGEVIYQIAEEIITDVRTTRGKIGVPRDTGTLANSLRAVRIDDKSAELTAGGAAAPYALVQHERTDFVHKQGESRYLVRGVERWRPGQARKALAQASEWAANYARGTS